jgi:hypothetical protein
MLIRMGFVLIAAAAIAALLMGAQLVPVIEFSSLTVRGSNDGPHTIFPFSTAPHSVAEFFWPYLFGRSFRVNQSWLSFVPPYWHGKFWIPSLYVGGLTILTALGGFALRRAPSWRIWISAIGLLSLLLSFGECGGPLWLSRANPTVKKAVGPHDSALMGEQRTDGYLIDATGTPYWAATFVLPGFHSFRYPSKLLVFTSMALSVLAGVGWDGLTKHGSRRVVRLAVLVAMLSAVSLTAVILLRKPIFSAWSNSLAAKVQTAYGAFQPEGAFLDIQYALLQGGLIAVFVALVPCWQRRRPGLTAAAALIVMAADLGMVTGASVVTVPQSLFETKPEALRIIEKAEREAPSPGPYRIHRLPMWVPSRWLQESSGERVREFVAWERATIQPKYAIPNRSEYTITQGTAELFDYEFFFAAFYGNTPREVAVKLGLKPDEKIVYFPRRGFDLWNTRYFVLPFIPSNEESRGIAAFLPNATRIHPPKQTAKEAEEWARNEDWQILKNEAAYPRAWVVHEGRRVEPILGKNKADRRPWMEEILYQADVFWNSPNRVLYDPRRLAWIETDDWGAVVPFLSGGETLPGETVTVSRHEPQRVELDATLERPGVVVLADVFYPGWRIEINGKVAPILRANRAMRGALVQAGKSHLVFTYEPRSFRVGIILSGMGAVMLVGCLFWSWRRPVAPVVAGPSTTGEGVSS